MFVVLFSGDAVLKHIVIYEFETTDDMYTQGLHWMLQEWPYI
jgi:hypothetical protein